MKSTTTKIEPKTYLGDGLYCEDEDGSLRVFASDGFHVENTIYLEPDALQALITFARHRGYVIK